MKLEDPKVSDLIVCSYDEKHWVGLVDIVIKNMMFWSNSCIQTIQQDPSPGQGKTMYVFY